MKYRSLILAIILLVAVQMAAQAQTDFSFFGLGRAILSNDRLTGNAVDGDNSTINKGVAGYALFDLGGKLNINNAFGANFIFRMKNPYGSFYGNNTFFLFRQFQLTGKIGRVARYEIGDINFQATPYTMWNTDETFNNYESDAFAMRRNIQRYENFNFGNQWRLQGVQTFSDFNLYKGVKNIKLNLWALRTNSSNESTVPDRIMVGGRTVIKQSDLFSIGITVNDLTDVKINTSNYQYKNFVGTIDPKITFDKEAFNLQLMAETGISSYTYSNFTADSSLTYNDNFVDAKAAFVHKKSKIKLMGGYRYVGAQFFSPSAQTMRLNPNDSASTFTMWQNNSVKRPQDLYDRTTDEKIYNRNITPVLGSYMPEYGNVTPYGDATPNRKGASFGIMSDTSLKSVTYSANVDLLSEIIGEGTISLRKFTSIRGGAAVHFHKIFGWEKLFTISAGTRYENTTRDGSASVDFHSYLHDAGLTIEFLKKLDLLLGAKLNIASGLEYRSARNTYNQLTTYSPYNYNATQRMYSFGLRLRFTTNSYLSANYNIFQFDNKLNEALSYNRSQMFVNYTLSF
jgi:hypothetical protein